MHCGFAIAETESAADAEGEAAAWKLQEILGWTAGVEQHSRVGSTAVRNISVDRSSTAGEAALQIGAAQ